MGYDRPASIAMGGSVQCGALGFYVGKGKAVLPPLSWAGSSGMKEVDPRAYAMPGTVSGEPKPSLLTGVVSFIHLAIPVQQVRKFKEQIGTR